MAGVCFEVEGAGEDAAGAGAGEGRAGAGAGAAAGGLLASACVHLRASYVYTLHATCGRTCYDTLLLLRVHAMNCSCVFSQFSFI